MKNLIFLIFTLSMFATTSVHSRETPYYTALTPQGKIDNKLPLPLYSCPPDLVNNLLTEVNAFRWAHSRTLPFEHDYFVSRYSQSWATELARLALVKPNPEEKYGPEEMLFTSWWNHSASNTEVLEYPVMAEEIISGWIQQDFAEDYKFYGEEPPLERAFDSRRWTQLLWAETKRIGLGCATFRLDNDDDNETDGGNDDKGTSLVIVANFEVHGNRPGHFRSNVLPLLE